MIARISMVAGAALALASCGEDAPVRIIGSSTVYPFSSAVAAALVEAKKGPAPLIEETGTVAGFEKFCAGGGNESPDIADASRRMTKIEFRKCQDKKVGDLMEIAIGLDGIAIAESKAGPKLELTEKDLYLALAANSMGKPNTAKTWKDVNPKLPAIPILVMGPPPSSGTREVFEQKILQPGCLAAMPAAKDLLTASDPSQLDHICRQIRADGPYVQGGENDDNIVGALEKNANALGIFGYSFLEKNAARLQGLSLAGSAPDVATIQSGKYPATRTLYLYVKLDNLKNKPALKEYLRLVCIDVGAGGPLGEARTDRDVGELAQEFGRQDREPDAARRHAAAVVLTRGMG